VAMKYSELKIDTIIGTRPTIEIFDDFNYKNEKQF
jgi:hypothetical protein